MSALADPTRCRMLLLLEKHELTVSELCAVLQMPQSSVSRHLKTLADDDWVASRRDGTSRFYSMPVDDLDCGGQPAVADHPRAGGRPRRAAGHDERRLRGVLEPPPRQVAGVLRHRGRRLGSSSRGAVRRRVLSVGRARPDRPGARRRRSRLRNGAAHRDDRARTCAASSPWTARRTCSMRRAGALAGIG